MKNLLSIFIVIFVVLISGCHNNNSGNNADKAVINKSFTTKEEQKADMTKQKADELNKDLDDMIKELNNEK